MTQNLLAAPTAPDDLICPSVEIFDADAVQDAMATALVGIDDPLERRKAVVGVLSEARAHGMTRLSEAVDAQPKAARAAARSYVVLADGLVTTVCAHVLHQKGINPASDPLAMIAVGGYGRAEMAPYSDVDLLFLSPNRLSPAIEGAIEEMLYIFWDLKLKVGHSSRTIRDCLKLGREDMTIRTSLLEIRHLSGDETVTARLHNRLEKELFWGTEAEFVEAKLAERADRHKKQGGQRYVVEPNVKEGKGGLRDLQSLYWIAKYVHHTDRVADLVEMNVFRPDEMETFRAAEAFLLSVRCHLHLLAGRALDQLTFDRQVEVAARLGYTDTGGRRAVEHFMQDYFRHATRVGELTRIVLTDLEARHAKPEPVLTRLLSRRRKTKPPYAILQNRLTVEDETSFLAEPVNLIRIFEEAVRTGTLLHPDALRLIAANLHLIDGDVQQSPEANRIFFDMLLKHANPERGLRRMNEIGALGAFIPEFEPIVAMMQFNMYHSYTVDEHTIQVVSHLARIEREELTEELPVASSILKDGVNRKLLYAALLLHDIGKGRQEDHSVLGARIARSLAPRFGFKKKEAETLEWLVRYHLLMSDMAQKRDIADPRTVRDFAKAVKTRERLDLLCVLTVCDISGVGPGVWNNWKAVLIRALYRQTRRALEEGLEALNREERGTEAKRRLRAALSEWDGKSIRAEIARHYPPYWQGLHVTAHVDIASLLREIADDEVALSLTPDEDRDATRVCFAAADHPGMFTRMCGALSLVGANVVDARTFTTKDGYATAAFWVQDSDESPYDESRLPRLRNMIERTLQGEVVAREALADRDKMKKREKAFRVPTNISFDNEGSEIYTIIEVDTRDRPGLLHDLTRTMASANIYIASAVIATYGEQVVDTFYVKDMFGLKFHSESKQRGLEKRLRAAIDAGAERARS